MYNAHLFMMHNKYGRCVFGTRLQMNILCCEFCINCRKSSLRYFCFCFLQEILKNLLQIQAKVDILCDQSDTIVPVHLRKLPVTAPLPIVALTSYSRNQVADENYILCWHGFITCTPKLHQFLRAFMVIFRCYIASLSI